MNRSKQEPFEQMNLWPLLPSMKLGVPYYIYVVGVTSYLQGVIPKGIYWLQEGAIAEEEERAAEEEARLDKEREAQEKRDKQEREAKARRAVAESRAKAVHARSASVPAKLERQSSSEAEVPSIEVMTQPAMLITIPSSCTRLPFFPGLDSEGRMQ